MVERYLFVFIYMDCMTLLNSVHVYSVIWSLKLNNRCYPIIIYIHVIIFFLCERMEYKKKKEYEFGVEKLFASKFIYIYIIQQILKYIVLNFIEWYIDDIEI